jgi:hypothetical protein
VPDGIFRALLASMHRVADTVCSRKPVCSQSRPYPIGPGLRRSQSELRTFFVSYNGMVPETTWKRLLFAALVVAAFVLGVAIAASVWEGGWKVDDHAESSDSDNRAP